MKLPLGFLLVLFAPPLLFGSLERAIVEARREVRQENMALLREREEVGRERRELHAKLTEREAAVAELRREVERLRRVRRQTGEEARSQRRALEQARRREADLRALAREARRSLEARLSSAASPLARDALDTIDAALREEGPDAAARAARETVEAHARLLERLAEPVRLPASAVLPDGLEVEGTAVLLGPLAWLTADNPLRQGVLADRSDNVLPRLWPVQAPEITTFAEGGDAVLPMDLTGGRALLLDEAGRPWFHRLQDGGVTMIPLALTALASLGLVLWKTATLFPVRGRDPALVQAVAGDLRGGDLERAAARVAASPQPLRTLLEGGLAHPRANAEELEELMHERMLGLIPRLDRHLGTLAVLGGVAPLLGLLGTVTGMIHTFELVTLFGSGNERILSRGISEALVTTMSGLVIAVPVLLAHAFLSRRVRVIISQLEQSIAGFIQARHSGEEAA